LKSQYGHFDKQNGQCTYTANGAADGIGVVKDMLTS
jgi:hypothetical protein